MDEPRPLECLVGNLWVPAWALRPGAYSALRGLEDAIPLWLLILSRDPDWRLPCYASRESLGMTLGMARNAMTHRLRKLRGAHLLFELERDMDRKTRQHRPPARWACDPLAQAIWRPAVDEGLLRIAEEDAQDGRWVQRAQTALDAFDRRNRGLRNRLVEDMPFEPTDNRRRRARKTETDPSPPGNHCGTTAPGGPGFRTDPRPDLNPEGRGSPGGLEAMNGKRTTDRTARESRRSAEEQIGSPATVEQTRDPHESQAAQEPSRSRGSK